MSKFEVGDVIRWADRKTDRSKSLFVIVPKLKQHQFALHSMICLRSKEDTVGRAYATVDEANWEIVTELNDEEHRLYALAMMGLLEQEPSA